MGPLKDEVSLHRLNLQWEWHPWNTFLDHICSRVHRRKGYRSWRTLQRKHLLVHLVQSFHQVAISLYPTAAKHINDPKKKKNHCHKFDWFFENYCLRILSDCFGSSEKISFLLLLEKGQKMLKLFDQTFVWALSNSPKHSKINFNLNIGPKIELAKQQLLLILLD